MRPDQTVAAQLSGGGVDPSAIGLIVMTHLHFDHAGGLRDFPGATVLVHAAAGGVGTAAVQIASAFGARVVAAVGSAEKLDVCLDLGAAEAYVYDELPADLRVDAVLDPVGGELFERALGLLRPLGTLVAIGFAGGMWPELSPAALVGRNVGVQGFYLGRLLRHGGRRLHRGRCRFAHLGACRRSRCFSIALCMRLVIGACRLLGFLLRLRRLFLRLIRSQLIWRLNSFLY